MDDRIMILKEDLYKILSIKKDASKKEIRRAYYRLAKKYHPDINPGDIEAEKRFREIQQAYEYLINDKTSPNQITDQLETDFYSAMQDHPFHNLREMTVKYFSDRGWLKNGNSKK